MSGVQDYLDLQARAANAGLVARLETRIRELEGELAECRSSRQREHDLRVKIAGDLEGTQEAFRRSDDKRAAAEAERDRAREARDEWCASTSRLAT